MRPERDSLLLYIGLQTIYDRYLLHIENRRIETPQYFWMRVAMGLASKEGALKEQRAIEFYNMLSTFRFTSATPTVGGDTASIVFTDLVNAPGGANEGLLAVEVTAVVKIPWPSSPNLKKCSMPD